MTKEVYLLVSNGGDGSYSICATMNADWIAEQGDRFDNGEIDCESGIGCDGDGFHYDVITVPDECTLESLGLSDCAVED